CLRSSPLALTHDLLPFPTRRSFDLQWLQGVFSVSCATDYGLMPMASPLSIIIFGASGDLTCRKLIPSLYRLFGKQRLPEETRIIDRKSTRLNSSHQIISYAVFCFKK